MNQLETTSPLVTPLEASRITGYSHYWLSKKRVQGGGPPFVKSGQFVYYVSSGLDRFKKPKRRTRQVIKRNKIEVDHV